MATRIATRELGCVALSALGALALRARRRVLGNPIELAFDRVLLSADLEGDDVGIDWRIELRHGAAISARKLRLCWVAEDGSLHHYYELSSEDDEHEEHSCCGHAFVVFREPLDGVEGLPTNVCDIAQAELVCAFRSRLMASHASAVDRTQLVVRITAEADTTAGASSAQQQLRHHYTVAAFTQPMPDDEYRVLVRAPADLTRTSCARLPPPAEDWTLRYVFACPPLPGAADGFDAHMHTVYVWGDIDFDGNGATGPVPISGYQMNQIVPQVCIRRRPSPPCRPTHALPPRRPARCCC